MVRKTRRAAILAATVALGGFGYAFAQTPGGAPGPGPGPGPGQGPAIGSGMMQGQMPPGMAERMQEMQRRMEEHEGDERHHGRYGMGMGWGSGPGSGFAGGPGPLRFCLSAESHADRMIGRLERTTQPKPEQRAEFDALKVAAQRAERTVKAGCPTATEREDRTPTGRLALAEKGATAMAEAIRTVRPAFDAYYAKLDDKQRDRMRWAGGMWDGGRWDRDGDDDRRGPPPGAPGQPGQTGRPGQR